MQRGVDRLVIRANAVFPGELQLHPLIDEALQHLRVELGVRRHGDALSLQLGGDGALLFVQFVAGDDFVVNDSHHAINQLNARRLRERGCRRYTQHTRNGDSARVGKKGDRFHSSA